MSLDLLALKDANALRLYTLAALRNMDNATVDAAGVAVGLPRFGEKVRDYPSDITLTMLIKVVGELDIPSD